MTNFYPSQRFSSAISSMATSPKTIHERLVDAFNYDLIHVKASDLPQNLQLQFSELLKRVTSVKPTNQEGSLVATISKMTTDEAVDIAHKIQFLYHEIESSLPS